LLYSKRTLYHAVKSSTKRDDEDDTEDNQAPINIAHDQTGVGKFLAGNSALGVADLTFSLMPGDDGYNGCNR